jgi:hypothetical protein
MWAVGVVLANVLGGSGLRLSMLGSHDKMIFAQANHLDKAEQTIRCSEGGRQGSHQDTTPTGRGGGIALPPLQAPPVAAGSLPCPRTSRHPLRALTEAFERREAILFNQKARY